MLVEKDVRVITRDGAYIAVDIFRPEGSGRVPVIASFGPYGKDIHWPARYGLYELAPQNEHMVWETPDPVWWVARGYAILRADTRGTGASPGDLDLFGPRDAEDFYDVIEWAGTQPWSNGKVASSGISWLAMMGWRVAALNPPHLAALVAWEGSTDFYRELAYQGGLYCDGFIESWWQRQIEPQVASNEASEWPLVLPQHPLLDDYHRARQVDLDKVTVPLLSAGNWGALHIHLRGNIEGWSRAASKEKWLVVHTGTHIGPYYEDWALDLQLRFLDTFLKGKTGQMESVAPVRLAIRRGEQFEWRDSVTFPLPNTSWRELYLEGDSLLWARPAAAGDEEYVSTYSLPPVPGPLEITGPISLRLWVQSGQSDFDVIAHIQHIGRDGDVIPAVGPSGSPIPMAMGWLRASHRETDNGRSLPYRPWHLHDRELPVPLGEPTLLEVEVWPTSITLAEGESLRLELLIDDSHLLRMSHSRAEDRKPATDVRVLTGGIHASHLLLPIVSPDEPSEDRSGAQRRVGYVDGTGAVGQPPRRPEAQPAEFHSAEPSPLLSHRGSSAVPREQIDRKRA